jgi:hypothetical protein
MAASIVYFLGAGASLGAGATAPVQGGGKKAIPTQTTFWETFLRFCSSKSNKRTIESFLFRYFLGYKRVPGRLDSKDRGELLSAVDVEEVFTFLSERARAPSTTSQLRTYVRTVWAALTEEVANVFGHFKPNTETKKTYRAFVNRHFRKGDTVVSFNYDTIFEHSLPPKKKFFYESIQDQKKLVPLLKPHGSINWDLNQRKQIVVRDSPPHPIIVAPTHLKFIAGPEPNDSDQPIGYLDQADGIREIWARMEARMKEASALVFIGYSFPLADLYFSSVLRSVLAYRDNTPRVVVVNPDAVAIADRLKRRFPLATLDRYFDMQQYMQAQRSA